MTQCLFLLVSSMPPAAAQHVRNPRYLNDGMRAALNRCPTVSQIKPCLPVHMHAFVLLGEPCLLANAKGADMSCHLLCHMPCRCNAEVRMHLPECLHRPDCTSPTRTQRILLRSQHTASGARKQAKQEGQSPIQHTNGNRGNDVSVMQAHTTKVVGPTLVSGMDCAIRCRATELALLAQPPEDSSQTHLPSKHAQHR
jgi:hypothetical protein